MQDLDNYLLPLKKSLLGSARFSRIQALDSKATALLERCPVVSASGALLGQVGQLLIDVKTHKPQYVVLSAEHGAAVMIPWHALYFDSGLMRLVFYTFN